MKPRAIIVHELGHAIAALAAARELAVPIGLWSAPDAASYAGIGWFDAIVRQLQALPSGGDLEMVLDCGDRPELVQAALRQGLRAVCYIGDKRIAERLADIARQSRAKLYLQRPSQALNLLYVRDPVAACRHWLSLGKRAD